MVSVEDVIDFVRFHGNFDFDASTTRVLGETNVTIAASNGSYLADEYGRLDNAIEKVPKETTIGDPITLTLWAPEFFHMHNPSQMCNISQVLCCLEDTIINDLSLFFEPTTIQEIHGVDIWSGFYIDSITFSNICDFLQENGQIRLTDSARSRLDASLVPQHPFVTVDHVRFIIIHTERLMPPAFLLERATCSADRSHIRGQGPKFTECSGGKFSLRRNDVDHVVQECDSNGLYYAKQAIESIRSGSRSSQWTTIYRMPPPPTIIDDCVSSDEEPRFSFRTRRA